MTHITQIIYRARLMERLLEIQASINRYEIYAKFAESEGIEQMGAQIDYLGACANEIMILIQKGGEIKYA